VEQQDSPSICEERDRIVSADYLKIVERLPRVLEINVNAVNSNGRIPRHITEEESRAKNVAILKALACCKDNQTTIARSHWDGSGAVMNIIRIASLFHLKAVIQDELPHHSRGA
jgi:hypothetical protein